MLLSKLRWCLFGRPAKLLSFSIALLGKDCTRLKLGPLEDPTQASLSALSSHKVRDSAIAARCRVWLLTRSLLPAGIASTSKPRAAAATIAVR